MSFKIFLILHQSKALNSSNDFSINSSGKEEVLTVVKKLLLFSLCKSQSLKKGRLHSSKPNFYAKWTSF